jgi:hypothetical protein
MFKKKKPKYKQITNIKQIKAHLREFLFDSQVPDADELSLELGCVPLSDELLEKEEEESDRRVEVISHLMPLLYGYASLFSEAFVSTMPVPVVKNPSPETDQFLHDMIISTKHQLEDVMAHLLIGSVSQMNDLGLIQVEKRK